jgi:4-alpha-glucanotransferase
MVYPKDKRRISGLAAPLSALWTEGSLGIGEFADLPALGRLCRASGLEIIQILPVNDTGSHSSPYFALSAFALNPVYARLSDFPEAAACKQLADDPRFAPGKGGSVRYGDAVRLKEDGLRLMYASNRPSIVWSEQLERWIKANPWSRAYAAFKALKAENGDRGWKEWKNFKNPSKKDIDAIWEDPARAPEIAYHCWVQMRLEEQLRSAATALGSMGIALKGDLPIMLNEDSADVWADRRYFRSECTAGSPPDGEAPFGQNWGFPVYDREALERDDFAFWKARLAQADKFYHAFRIDHVLGFFRIWAVPERDHTAFLGRFMPGAAISEAALAARGFDPGRVKWLSLPHIDGNALRASLGGEVDPHGAFEMISAKILERIGEEDLFLFKKEIRGEKDIREAVSSEQGANELCRAWRDRALIPLEGGAFAQAWRVWDSRAFKSLSDWERRVLEGLFDEAREESRAMWIQGGKKILEAIRSASSMLVCAEDLGAIPPGVPEALAELEILGLRICRWARKWDKPGKPFVLPSEYPEASVCALSVHDTSTLRGWWEREGDSREFYKALGAGDAGPPGLTPELAGYFIEGAAKGASRLFIPAIQDYLALSPAYAPKDPEAERINVPGREDERNWSYRLPAKIEDLEGDAHLVQEIRRTSARGAPASGGRG